MLWLITSFFNTSDYQKPLRNYKLFAERLRQQGVPLLAIELAFYDRPFVLPKQDVGLVRLRSQSLLWQKERLLNYAISLLPPACDKVAWVDADILFEDASFVKLTEQALDKFDVVQMFSRSYRLNPEDTSFTTDVWSQEGAIASWSRGAGLKDTTIGFAWAARRSFLEATGGLYDRGVLGGGDTLLLNALLNQEQPRYRETIYQDTMAWTDKCRALVPQVGYVPLKAAHLWHGSTKNRRYYERHNILTKHEFNPLADIYSINNVWEWSTLKPALHQDVKDYFLGRREDLAA